MQTLVTQVLATFAPEDPHCPRCSSDSAVATTGRGRMRNVDLNPGQGCSLANNAKKTYNARKFYASKHLTSAHNPVRASDGLAQYDDLVSM